MRFTPCPPCTLSGATLARLSRGHWAFHIKALSRGDATGRPSPIVASPPETPEPLRTEISFRDHAQGAADIEALLGVPRHLLRDGEGWAVEEFTRLGTHNTTHVDAPWHYNSTIAGEPAPTIDELPLEWTWRREWRSTSRAGRTAMRSAAGHRVGAGANRARR